MLVTAFECGLFADNPQSVITTNSVGLSDYPEDGLVLDYVSSALWSRVQDMIVEDEYVYCAMSAGIQIFDISNANEILSISRLFIQEGTIAIAKRNSKLFVHLRDGGLAIVDISDRFHPKKISSISSNCNYHEGAIVVDQDYAFLGCRNQIDIINITNLYHPKLIDTYVIDTAVWVTIHDMVIKDEKAFIAAYDLWVLDISRISSINEISRIDFPNQVLTVDIEVRDSLLFSVCRSNLQPPLNSALTVMNISDLMNPEIISMALFPGNADYLSIDENYAYVSASLSGLVVYDITDINSLQPVGCHHTPEYFTLKTCLIGEYLIAAQRGYFPHFDDYGVNVCDNDEYYPETEFIMADQLLVYDLHDKSSPNVIASYFDAGFPIQIEVFADYAYIYDLSGGLSIVDISHIDDPDVLSYLELEQSLASSFSMQMTIHDEMAYLPQLDKGVSFIDVISPFDPELFYTYDSPGLASDAEVIDTFLLVADGPAGLQLLILNSNAPPVYDRNVLIPGMAIEIEVKNDYAFVAANSGGLQILDITDVSNAFITSSILEGQLLANSIAVGSNFVAVAGTGLGFYIVDISDINIQSKCHIRC
jgi:hypothetical protein